MANPVFDFLARHSSLVITTHEPADADGLGAERVFRLLATAMGKDVRIVNSGPPPENFQFLDPGNTIEIWKEVKETIPRGTALVILDTTDEYNIGELREMLPLAAEIFVIDHHEPNQFCTFSGYIDNSASSTSELIVELIQAAGIKLDPETASAAYAGVVYDTGFFAYSKTTTRTFKVALALVEAGVNPYSVYQELNENASTGALLLQKQVLSTLEIHNQGRVAVQVLRKEDLENSGARYEDAENFINIPLKSREIEVSILIKENREGQTRCSLRSKGKVNVSKIAQALRGGGHVSAAGFKSTLGPDETLKMILERVTEALDKK
ncbi:MAG: bifunctional oligoribonuclease/PAP phosphatase NrnA [Treponema sp.]|nr:bifunctional oligoribonuclease/PAP phosphatase NrnA [Treponema sp.]